MVEFQQDVYNTDEDAGSVHICLVGTIRSASTATVMLTTLDGTAQGGLQ